MNLFLFSLAIVFSLISQLPMLLDSEISTYMKMFWVIPGIYIIPKNLKLLENKSVTIFLAFLLFFSFYCMLMEIITGSPYVGADLNNILISFLIFLVSICFFANNHSQKVLNVICCILLFVSMIVAYIVSTSASLITSLSELQYAYQNKNSMGQILLSSILFCSFLYRPSLNLTKLYKWGGIAFLIVVMMVLKSRATILGFIFAVLYVVFFQKNKKIKYFLFLLVLLFLLFVMFNSSVYEILIDNILFANQDFNDFNALSSNRADGYPLIFNGFLKSPFWGNGNKYFDCMPLIMLYQYGLFGAGIVFFFLIYLFLVLKKHHSKCSLNNLSYLLLCVFLINSLFEAQAPFGPGIKSFLLWMTVGFSTLNSSVRCDNNPHSLFYM